MCYHPRRAALFLVSLLAFLPLLAGATTIDFESYGDGDPVTDPFPGVALTNATALVAGASLNEFEFPPHSGNTVVFDDGGPIIIDFATPAGSVGAYFTYVTALTLSAFDAALNVIGTDLSLFGSNLALSGDPGSSPNEFLGITSLSGISRVTISGDLGGGSFTMDDLTFEPHQDNGNGVPEPPIALLLAAGVVVLGSSRVRIRRRPS
jgi:hypothetical protein